MQMQAMFGDGNFCKWSFFTWLLLFWTAFPVTTLASENFFLGAIYSSRVNFRSEYQTNLFKMNNSY